MKRILIRPAIVLLLLNMAFLLARIAGTYLPRDGIRNALKDGFAAQTATEDDYPGSGDNRLLGLDQFTDCVSMEIAAVGDPAHLVEAVSPHLAEKKGDLICGDLKQFLYANTQVDTRNLYSYTRF